MTVQVLFFWMILIQQEERSSDPRFVRIDRIQSMLEPEYAKINLFFEEQVEKLSQRQTQLEAEAQMLTQVCFLLFETSKTKESINNARSR